MTKETKNLEKTNKTTKKSRPKRKAMGRSGPLAFPDSKKDPNYVYRWVSDKDWNMQDKMDRGYEFVEGEGKDYRADSKSEASQTGSNVSKPVGNNTTGYLMRIPKEWYDEDQAEKRKENEETAKAKTDSSNLYDKQIDIE